MKSASTPSGPNVTLPLEKVSSDTAARASWSGVTSQLTSVPQFEKSSQGVTSSFRRLLSNTTEGNANDSKALLLTNFQSTDYNVNTANYNFSLHPTFVPNHETGNESHHTSLGAGLNQTKTEPSHYFTSNGASGSLASMTTAASEETSMAEWLDDTSGEGSPQVLSTSGFSTAELSLNQGTSFSASLRDALLSQSTPIASDTTNPLLQSVPRQRSKILPDLGANTGVFQATQISDTTQSAYATNVPEDTRVSSPNGSEFSSELSSVFQNLIDRSQDTISTLPSHAAISNSSIFHNHSLYDITNPLAIACDFANASSNVTDIDAQQPGLYDVIIEQFDVSEETNLGVTVAKAATLAMMAVAGVVGNALVIWSVVRQRHLHRPPFYYLLSLSLTDLSRAAFCLPLVLMTLLQGSVWRHGNSACDLFAFANSFFVLSSVVSLLDIAADRHLSLVYPRSYRRRAGGVVNLVVVLLGWTLAFLVAFPPVVGVGAYAFEASEGQCTLRHRFFRHDNDTLGFLMVFTTLLLLTLFLYYRILLALRAHRRMRPMEYEPARSSTWTFVGPGANGQAFINWANGFGGTNVGPLPNLARNPPRSHMARVVSLHVARNQHVTRLFFLMTLAFSALWLPYQVLSYWRVFGTAEDIHTGFVTAAAWLSYGQVIVCPLVYFSSRGHTRRRSSRADLSPEDKQEYLLESLTRKK